MNAISLTSKPTLFAIIFAFSIVRHDLIHGASALARGEATPEVMTLSALESSWDWRKLTLTISGSVQLKRGSLSIRCDHAKILFRAKDSTLSKDHTFPQEDPTASVLSFGNCWNSSAAFALFNSTPSPRSYSFPRLYVALW